MLRSLPIGRSASCLHKRSVLLTYQDLILISPTCVHNFSWFFRVLETLTNEPAWKDFLVSPSNFFETLSIVWSLDTPVYMHFNCSTPGAVEMADRWLDGAVELKKVTLFNIQLRSCYSTHQEHHPQNLSFFWRSMVIRIIKPSTGLFNFQNLNRSKFSLQISMFPPDLVHASLKNQGDARNLVQPQVRWAQVNSCDDDCDLRKKHQHKFLISMSRASTR